MSNPAKGTLLRSEMKAWVGIQGPLLRRGSLLPPRAYKVVSLCSKGTFVPNVSSTGLEDRTLFF